jgi:hypothetical protein
MANYPPRDISRLFGERTPIDEAMSAAFREAALRHKQMGQPLVVWRDGKTVLIPPDEIEVPDPPRRNARY